MLLNENITKKVKTDIEIVITKDNIRQELSEDFLDFVDLNEDLKLLDSAIIDKVKIKKNNYYLYKYTDGSDYNYPIFFYVYIIVKQHDEIKVLGYLVSVLYFDRKMYSYKLSDSDTIKELDVNNLPYYKKLKYVDFNDSEYICRDFHIDFDLICYQI